MIDNILVKRMVKLLVLIFGFFLFNTCYSYGGPTFQDKYNEGLMGTNPGLTQVTYDGRKYRVLYWTDYSNNQTSSTFLIPMELSDVTGSGLAYDTLYGWVNLDKVREYYDITEGGKTYIVSDEKKVHFLCNKSYSEYSKSESYQDYINDFKMGKIQLPTRTREYSLERLDDFYKEIGVSKLNKK